MEFPAIFSDALKLPAGAYYTPKLARIKSDEVTLVRMGGVALTNASSEVPVIGTQAFNPCCAIIIYNTKSKTAVLKHLPWLNGSEFKTLLDMARTNPSEQVEVHIIGKPIMSKDDRRAHLIDCDGMNKYRVRYLTDTLDALANEQNVSLKTFDVLDKPKPHAVAIDARNGNLIRGTKLFKTEEETNKDIDRNKHGPFDVWHCVAEQDENFDGTVRELQRQTRR